MCEQKEQKQTTAQFRLGIIISCKRLVCHSFNIMMLFLVECEGDPTELIRKSSLVERLTLSALGLVKIKISFLKGTVLWD